MERRSPVAPFVLPGESIAKYRNRTPVETTPQEEEHAQELEQEIARQPEDELAQTAAEAVKERESLSVTLDRDLEREYVVPKVEPRTEEVADEDVEPVVAEHGAVGGTTEPAAEAGRLPQPAADTEDRYEQMNVASTFAGEAAEEPKATEDAGALEEPGSETSAVESDSHEHGHEHGEEAFAEAEQPVEDAVGTEPATEPRSDEERHGYSAKAGHTLEQEEIEDEESEYHPYSEEDEQDSYVELEEETFEPSATAAPTREKCRPAKPTREVEEVENANGLTDAVHDAIIDEETTEAEYPESSVLEDEEAAELTASEDLDEGDEDEFEESELEVDEHGAAIPHADSRIAEGAYPQRPSRPGYDRRGGRGRRGGRRMRGGPRRETPRQVPLISDLLKEGQEVLIQIAKEPIGKKGARITSHIALPGRYLVYMPTVNHIGVSRKINSDEERQRLKRIMISEREGGHGGFIVRTAAEGITEEELRADIRFLKNLWHDIKTRSDNSKAPALIYHDLNLVERVLRDQVTADFSAIWVDTESEYERILRFAQRFQSQLVRKVKLYTKSAPLYEQFGIKEEIDKALKSKVWLKSGGYIVINQTEALVAIDVNTGKYVGKTARLEDTIVKTNVDAIKEIVRQIRLRDLGGIIVIDFIDMDERKNRQKVMQALEEAMKSDRAPSKVLAFNDFGLVAITRKRVKQSLERTLGEPCPYCTSTGLVKSVNTMCNEIYVEMRKMSQHLEGRDVILRVNPEVAKALKANGGKWIQEMEDLTRKTILVKSDALLHQENFDIQA
jgi:ribonuclease G